MVIIMTSESCDENLKKIPVGDFPGGPGVKNLTCHSRDVNLIPGQRTKIPQAAQPRQKREIEIHMLLHICGK